MRAKRKAYQEAKASGLTAGTQPAQTGAVQPEETVKQPAKARVKKESQGQPPVVNETGSTESVEPEVLEASAT